MGSKALFTYKAFGYILQSEIRLPECTATDTSESIDITIAFNDLQDMWSQLAIPNESFVIREDLVMFEVPEAAIYAVQNGNQITVSPLPGHEEDVIRLYLLGTCMGVVLMQRKVLPLHGSAVVIGGKAYAIVGESGAGKSTLATAFLSKGYPLLSDDVIPVTVSSKGKPYVTPAYPQQKLWLESLNGLGLQPEGYRPVIGRATKFAVPTLTGFADEPSELAGVFELVPSEQENVAISALPKLEQMLVLYLHTYRNFLISPAGLMQWHFETTAHLLSTVPVRRLYRPTAGFTAHDLASLVVQTIENED